MSGNVMWIVTDVAPYRDGPAGVHGVLTQARTALAEIGSLAGLEPIPVERAADLEASEVEGGGVLALFTIGETAFGPETRKSIWRAWAEGRLRVLGVHSATDACHGWAEYGTMLGARFDGHPWTRPFDVDVVDTDHPATAGLPARWAWRDEVYLFRALRADARILLSLSPGDLDMTVPGARIPECGLPLAWCIDEAGGGPGGGRGRTFYTALGHFSSAWETPTYLRHLAGGLSWLRS